MKFVGHLHLPFVLAALSSCLPPDVCSSPADVGQLTRSRHEQGLQQMRLQLEDNFDACQRAVAQACVAYAGIVRRNLVAPIPGFSADDAVARALAVHPNLDDTADDQGQRPHVPPKFVSAFKVPLPQDVADSGVNGYVVLRVLVNSAGEVQTLYVADSEPLGFFEDTASTTIRTMRFHPATNDGLPVDAWMTIRIRFDMRGTRTDPRCRNSLHGAGAPDFE